MRVIQVGTGFWGASWLGIVARSPECELAAVVDQDASTLRRAADAAQVPAERRFPSLAAALASVEADAALVVVPPSLHAAVVHEVLSAGLHCLVEKPMAATLRDAWAMVDRAETAGRVLMVDQDYRYGRGAQTVRALVGAGVVGRVASVWITFARSAPPGTGFRYEMDEPLLLDMAIHHLDALRGTLGLEPVRVWARSFNPPGSPFRGNASACVELETEDGVVASYRGDLAHRGPRTPWTGVWDIQGERGSIRWKDGLVVLHEPRPAPGRLSRRLRRGAPGRRMPLVTVDAEGRAATLARLAAAARDGHVPETGARDNLRSLALALGAVAAAQRGESVDLRSLLAGNRPA